MPVQPSWLTWLTHPLVALALVVGVSGAIASPAMTQAPPSSAVLFNERSINQPSTDNPFE